MDSRKSGKPCKKIPTTGETKMNNNRTRIEFEIKFKENKKTPLAKYDKWTQLQNLCKLAEDTSLEVGQSFTNHNHIIINYDNTYRHILLRVADIMRILESFVTFHNGTMEVIRESFQD